jgi:hypothetical protein
VERKNRWQLAEYGSYQHPRTIQRVLDRSAWDADAVRDDLSDQVVAELGDEAGIPKSVALHTRPWLALEMIERALAADVPAPGSLATRSMAATGSSVGP